MGDTRVSTGLVEPRQLFLSIRTIVSVIMCYVSLLCFNPNMPISGDNRVSIRIEEKTELSHAMTKGTLGTYAYSDGPDQTARMRSLIKAFAIR